MPLLLKHGIIKEKFATLLTDSIRSEVLSSFGYKSDIIEFISAENTPKNILIRAFKNSKLKDKEKLKKLEEYLKTLNAKMYLIEEAKKLLN